MKKSALGLQISALIRAYLNLHSELSWPEIEIIGEKINQQIEEVDWLSTDKGVMFEKVFNPESLFK